MSVTAAQEADVSGAEIGTRWFDAFARALLSGDVESICELFSPDGWLRDNLALSWDLRSYRGRAQIAAGLREHLAAAGFVSFTLSPDFGPRERTIGRETRVEVVFAYEAGTHRGRGAALLLADDGGVWRAWTAVVAMEALIGHEESATSREAIRGSQYSDPEPGRRRWCEQREDAREFRDRECAVLIIGAGHSGLGIAARLERLGVATLVVDRCRRVGDSWRRRYANLQLHGPYWADHLPYLRFPDSTNWPAMLPKDKLADWLEMYGRVMDINVWTATEVADGSYREAAGEWTIRLRHGGEPELRTIHPRHVVLATGLFTRPYIPQLIGTEEFAGEIVHASAFTDGKHYTGANAVVIGAGASGIDIAQDLCEQGANTTIVQRSSTYVMSTVHGLYSLFANYGGPDGRDRLDDIDLLSAAIPFPLVVELDRQRMVPALAELDGELLDGLNRAGFRTNQEGFRSVGFGAAPGGFYIDQGGCALIVEGKIKVKRSTIVGFSNHDALFGDGSTLPADLVVLATGYENMRESARELFGDAVADRCGEVWGIDPGRNEIRTMWRDSGHPGLWFHSGPLVACRYYSRTVALQIKAHEIGLL
jgi:putative flavoprotein involved in K+ transport